MLLLLPILPCEVLLLSIRFDAGQLAEQTGVWAWLLVYSSRLLKALLAAVTAGLLFSNTRMWRDAGRVLREQAQVSSWRRYLVGHAVSAAAFTALTANLFEGDLLAVAPGLLASAWCLLGLCTFGMWLAAMLPPALWPQFARIFAQPLLAGTATGAAAWAFGTAMTYFWEPLGQASFALVRSLLLLSGFEVISNADALTIGTSTFLVEISPDCSGYEGIGLILVFLGVYLALFRQHLRFPHVLLLLPAGAALIWLANAVRITLLIVIGSAGAEAVALGGFHSQAGWLAFNALALGFVGLTTRAAIFQAEPTAQAERRGLDPTVAYLAPWLAILVTTLLVSAFSAGFDWLYPVRVVAAVAALWCCRKSFGTWDGSVSWLAVALGVIVFAVWMLLAPAEMMVAAGPPSEWTEAEPIWATLWVLFRVGGAVLTVPLAEELAFRGYLTRRLMRRDFEQVPLGQMTWLSVVVSSVLFGLLHGSCWPAGIVAGVLFAVALRWRGRLADAVAAHLTANALLSVYVLWTGNWLLWN